MPRYIDAENAISVLEILADKCADDKSFEQTIFVLKDAPAVDAVEVVRCKDCQYFDQAEKYCCDFLTAEEDGFCKWGKRREDEESTKRTD